MSCIVVVLGAAAVVARPARAIDIPLDRRALEEAIAIGRSSLDAGRARFHGDYRLAVSNPPVDFVEIVTPFRRVALAAEAQHRQGRRVFGQREALQALQPEPDRIDVFVELTFHPQNTFVQVPLTYGVELVPVSTQAPAVQPAVVERLPRFGQRLAQPTYPYSTPYPVGPIIPSTGAQPLLGGTLIAQVPGARVDPKALHDVVVKDGKTELARARVDLARLR